MGYLDYTLAKLNAAKAIEDTRYRDRQLQEANKAQFISSLVGLVPQAIGGISDAANKQALAEDSLNKLRIQEALLTGGDNTLATTAKGPVAAAPAGANTFGFVNTPIEEEDNSLPGSERLASSGSDGGEGPPTDTSPNFNPLMDGLKRVTSDEEKLAQYEIASLRDAADGIMRRGGPSQDVEGQMPLSANRKPYTVTGGIVPGSVRRLETVAAKPTINTSGSTTEIQPNNIQSSFDIAQALAALGAKPAAADIIPGVDSGSDGGEGAPTDTSPNFVPDPNRDLGKSSFDISAPLSKLGPFSQAKLAGAKEAMRDADIKAAAVKQAPLPLPVPVRDSLLEDTGRRGPSMPGAVGDENIEGENPTVYRKRMEAKGYSPKKVNELIKKNYVTGSGTVDITEETGTGGGPKGAIPFQIGGNNPPTFYDGSFSGGFGGAPVANKPWIKEKKVIPEGDKPAVVVPEVPQLSATEQLRIEEKDRQDALNKRLVDYKRITNDDFKEPNIDKLAEKAVNEIFTKRPPGNPISEMLNNITGAGQMTAERERLMRSIAKKTIIKNIKAERKAIADDDAEQFINKTKLEIDSAFKSGKTIGLQSSKKQIPDSARRELDSQNEANIMLNDVRDEAYQIAAETGTIPVGKTRFMKEARINEIASKIGMTGKALSAGFLGASLGGSKSQAGPFVDPELLVKAFKATDFSDLSPKEQRLVQLMTQSIQVLGKAREGGKLTDADYNKYVSTLFNSDNPAAFIESLDDLIDRNAARYNKNLVYFTKNYGDDLSMFDAAGRREQEYELDWNQIQEKPLSAAASAVGGGGSEKKKNTSPPKPPPTKVDSDF